MTQTKTPWRETIEGKDRLRTNARKMKIREFYYHAPAKLAHTRGMLKQQLDKLFEHPAVPTHIHVAAAEALAALDTLIESIGDQQ